MSLWRQLVAMCTFGLVIVIAHPLCARSGIAVRLSDSSEIAIGVPISFAPAVQLEPGLRGSYSKSNVEESTKISAKSDELPMKRRTSFRICLEVMVSPSGVSHDPAQTSARRG